MPPEAGDGHASVLQHLEKQMNIFRVFLLATASILWHSDLFAGELQLNCIFTSSVKLVSMDPASPKYETKKMLEEFLVFVDQQNRDASYINLKFKNKSPLDIVHSNPSMMTFV